MEVDTTPTASSSAKSKSGKGTWQALGVDPIIAKALTQRGFKIPTPIQRASIPLLIGSPPRDVLGMARTGSGKTFAYIIPLLQRLISPESSTSRALILIPTRELALQVMTAGKDLSRGVKRRGDAAGKPLRWGLIMGGDALDKQFELMESKPDILITTPGRLLHLLVEMSADLRDVGTVVYDEADRLFEMGFQVQLHEILSRLPTTRQSMLFSATLPTSVAEFARAGLSNPAMVRLDAEYRINPDLTTYMLRVNESEKDASLLSLLATSIKVPFGIPSEGQPQAIVFVATKHHVEYVAALLEAAQYQASYVYGNLDQVARQSQLRDFRDRRSSILVVTDVAARGLDVPMVDHVINYDFPANSRVFVHRTGRTARGGRQGTAWSLVEKTDLPYFCDLNAFLRTAGQETILHAMSRQQVADMAEHIASSLDHTSGLTELRAVMLRGEAMYRRSRTKASTSGYKAARTLPSELVEFDAREEPLSSVESKRQDLLSSISAFRPSTPAVPATEAARKRTSRPVQVRAAQAVEPMEAAVSRSALATEVDVIDRAKFRDSDFYLQDAQPIVDGEKEYSLASAGLGDQKGGSIIDDDQLRHRTQKASQLRWDRKQKNFTQGSGDKAEQGKMIKTESGALLPATYNSGKYRQWKANSRHVVPDGQEPKSSQTRGKHTATGSGGLLSSQMVHKRRVTQQQKQTQSSKASRR